MIGSTSDGSERVAKDQLALKRAERASMEGLAIEMQIIKDQMKMISDKCDSAVNLFGTLQNMFNTFQSQRAIELHSLLGGGPTSK